MPTILLIDDDENMHKIFRCYCRMGGRTDYEIVGVKTLEAGLHVMRQTTLDAVLLDNRLQPFSDIRETLPHITSEIGSAKLYVISAHIDEPYLSGREIPGVDKVIDKFELRNEITGGVLNLQAA
ncbi:response regulator transcription factor [Oricola cellulosilytica]|uniref:Response regulator transcription factor n=1 Tax=Oricola cellulosilytica TaxID=1429082 RepID=A0A4R0PFI5_9HYPH|nr:response regulator transcription factor [Oricola cellulosilytica]TCD16605.1 response regulator transcription factor [Oricola cellulosilytica]